MLIDFFLHLKEHRLPVSTTEYLTLLEALEAGFGRYSIDAFYALARACLVKNETNYDKFDVAFGKYVESLSGNPAEYNAEISVDDIARAAALLNAGDPELADTSIDSEPYSFEDGEDSAIEKRPEEIKPMGHGGNSPVGQGGSYRQGARLEGETPNSHRALKAWDNRQFKGFDDSSELGARNIKMALRRLRKFAREGAQEEFDLEETIACTAKNGGWLDIRMRPERRNKVKVLILFDYGGSMDSHVKQVQELFDAVRTEFKQLEYYYFHNCIYETVWRYDGPSLLLHYPLRYLINKFGKDYKLIIVGDASMAPIEIFKAGEELREASDETGDAWMRRLLEHFRHAVWLNPEPEQYWLFTQSIQILRDIMEDRMYPLTLEGIDRAMRRLSL